jgi:hypothetical protein
MDYAILALIGLAMGSFGGLLGIGGSVVMIPALVLAFGENQHLYQAAAMICNFFVGGAAALVHRKADVLMVEVVTYLIPTAAVGILIGVALSNSSAFARENSHVLARVFGGFVLYVACYNLLKFRNPPGGRDGLDVSGVRRSRGLTMLVGLLTGIPAGLLGIGGGVVCTPLQQLFLRMPLKRAISNSAGTVAAIALFGAVYKNATLPQHDVALSDSLRIAACVIPGAVVGAFAGGRLMHALPKNWVRAVFVALMLLASYRMLTVAPGA